MTRRIVAGIVLAVGILFPAASTAAQTQTPKQPAGSIGIGLLEAPVSRENDPRAKTYIIDHLAQGATISRKIQVVNATNQPQLINLYAGAAQIANGSFITKEGRGGNDVAGWTTVSPPQVNIPAGQTAQAEVTITVPQGVNDGERYGVVWAERVNPPSGPGITVINRVGIRIYLSVGNGTEPVSNFTIESLTAERLPSGEPQVTAKVRNTGGRALDMNGTLNLRNGPGGLTAGPFAVQLGTTLGIGQTEPVKVKLDKQLPAGPWNAELTLKSGELEHSAQATITFPKSGAAAPVKPKSSSSAVTKIFLPLAGLLLALFVALLFVLRRRRSDEVADVKADLERFRLLVRRQRLGTLEADDEDPEVAIKAAIKRASRTKDANAEKRLKEALAEYRLQRETAQMEAAASASVRPTLDDIPGPVRESKPASVLVAPEPEAEPEPEPLMVEEPPAPAASNGPSMADILAGVTPEPPREPTRWSGLVDDIRARNLPAEQTPAEEGAPHESELAKAVREAAEQARKAAEDAASRGH